ncbi:hypothetical protein FG379_000325 [Cryptosporidium bovis]|uniref:uncharacterized protein n=1 Tax=Cryptosporidium bovis TaxID=310047 RepID=UPI00351A5F12|nr:hypothetical protein FG379_000325 [Cryptosporidium bovis]
MGKHIKKKNVVKLRLASYSGNGSSDPTWVIASNNNYTGEEKQKIKSLVGGVIFTDEYEPNLRIEKDNSNVLSINKVNINSPLEITIDESRKDDYFPDDGYDYEQHLCKINCDKFIRNVNKKIGHNESRESLLLSSTSILDNYGATLDVSQTLSELNEIFDCFDEVEEFDELNDDFILDATGLENMDEVGKNINVCGLLWGENGMNLSGEKEKLYGANDKLIVESNDDELEDSSLSLKVLDDTLVEILEEYNEANIFSNNNEIKDHITEINSINNNKYSYDEYEHILDEYIGQAKCYDVKNKQEKVIDINFPLERHQIEKIISIVDQTSFESSPKESDIEISDNEIENVSQTSSPLTHGIDNRPKKVVIAKIYPTLLPLNNKIGKKMTRSKVHDKYDLINNNPTHSCVLQTNRDKNETQEEKRERKNAFKQARREIREIKRRNKQDAKKLKNSIVSNFLGVNPYDIKNGFRHFRF